MAADRALLANVDVYIAEGNVRRGVSGFANNMLAMSASGEFQERRFTLEPSVPNEVKSVAGNVATIIRCTKPIKISVNVAPAVTPTVLTIKSLFIYTGELGDIILTNEGFIASKVTFLQI